jgi:hypothetical protein
VCARSRKTNGFSRWLQTRNRSPSTLGIAMLIVTFAVVLAVNQIAVSVPMPAQVGTAQQRLPTLRPIPHVEEARLRRLEPSGPRSLGAAFRPSSCFDPAAYTRKSARCRKPASAAIDSQARTYARAICAAKNCSLAPEMRSPALIPAFSESTPERRAHERSSSRHLSTDEKPEQLHEAFQYRNAENDANARRSSTTALAARELR